MKFLKKEKYEKKEEEAKKEIFLTLYSDPKGRYNFGIPCGN